MKKLYSRLTVILIMLLSLVMVISSVSLLITATASADAAEPSAQSLVRSEDESWYEITVGDDNKSLTILIDGTVGSYADLSKKDLTDIKEKLYDAVKRIVIDRLLSMGGGQDDPSTAALYSAVTVDAPVNQAEQLPELPDFNGSTLAQYEQYIKDRLKQGDELDKYLNGEYDVLIKYAVDRYLSQEESEEITKEFIGKVQEKVQDIVKEVIDDKYEELLKDETLTDNERAEIEAEWGAANDKNSSKVEQLVTEVVENGSASITVTELVKAIDSIAIDHSTVYSGGKVSLAAIKNLLLSLPKPAQIADFSDEDMRLSYYIDVNTRFGEIDFTLTLGLKSGFSHVRTAAKFIADHIDVANDNGTYRISVKMPAEFAAVLLKAANSNAVPDNIKHAMFNMLSMPANEIVDKVGDYTYEDILEYVKGIEFHRLFANVLNAEYLRGFFKGFGINIESLTDAHIDRLLNGVLNYAEKLANKQTVDGVEEFLQRYGISGIPAELEKAVQKFLDLLNKIDYERYDATEIRNFLTSKDRITNFIERIEGSYQVEMLYNKFVEYAEKLFNKLPQRLQNGKIINLYDDTNTFTWAGEANIDVKKIVTKLVQLVNKNGTHAELETMVDTALGKMEGDLNYNVSVDLSMYVPDIYKITYMAEDEVVGTGLLPVGADVIFFANKSSVETESGVFDIKAWSDQEGYVYNAEDKLEMPSKDVTLHAITGFNAELAVEYDGSSVDINMPTEEYDPQKAFKLSAATVGGIGYNSDEIASYVSINYQWYKTISGEQVQVSEDDIDVDGACVIQDVLQSGEYACNITYTITVNNGGNIVLDAWTEQVNITITPAEVNLLEPITKWTVTNTSTGETRDYISDENEYEYTGESYILSFVGWEDYFDEGKLLSEPTYHGDREATEPGSYEVYVTFDNVNSNYHVTLPRAGVEDSPIAWSIKEKSVIPPVEKEKVDLDGAEWMVYDASTGKTDPYEDRNYNYTGKEYRLTLSFSGCAGKIPSDLLTGYYVIGENEQQGETCIDAVVKTDAGTYKVYAIFNDKYEVSNSPKKGVEANPLEWTIKAAEVPGGEPGSKFTASVNGTDITVVDNNGVVTDPKNQHIIVNSVTSYTLADFENRLNLTEKQEAVLLSVLDISFEKTYEGEFKVSLENPAYAEQKEVVVFHIHDGQIEKLEVTVEGNKVSFVVSGFSEFASIGINDKQEPDNPDNPDNPDKPNTPEAADSGSTWWIWLLIAIIIVLLIVIIVLIIYLLHKPNGPVDDARPNVVIIKTDEVVEQNEEPVEEDTPEETAEPEEAPEETPAQDETAVAVAEESDNEGLMPLVAADGSRIVYDKSFSARLSQSPSLMKDYYTELKNDILSYKGVKSRVSWHFDSFNKGRTKCIKLQLRGKSMYMYIALPAAELPEKYHVSDVSDKSRYQDVPTMLKIRKPRSLKYAKQLVAILMERLGVQRGDTPTNKYRPRYKSTKVLIEEGLVKVKYTTSTFAAPKSKDTENTKDDGND